MPRLLLEGLIHVRPTRMERVGGLLTLTVRVNIVTRVIGVGALLLFFQAAHVKLELKLRAVTDLAVSYGRLLAL